MKTIILLLRGIAMAGYGSLAVLSGFGAIVMLPGHGIDGPPGASVGVGIVFAAVLVAAALNFFALAAKGSRLSFVAMSIDAIWLISMLWDIFSGRAFIEQWQFAMAALIVVSGVPLFADCRETHSTAG